jgi:hypothetical protein
MAKDDCLSPSAALLCKLGSLVVHAEEMLSAKGHHFDLDTIRSLLADSEVKAWLAQMDKLALLPKKR